MNQSANKLCIHPFKDKFDDTKLVGTAVITFEKSESVTKAIERYDSKLDYK